MSDTAELAERAGIGLHSSRGNVEFEPTDAPENQTGDAYEVVEGILGYQIADYVKHEPIDQEALQRLLSQAGHRAGEMGITEQEAADAAAMAALRDAQQRVIGRIDDSSE